MHDALRMGSFQGVDDLPRDRKRLIDRQGGGGQMLGQRRALDQLHHQSKRRPGVFEAVNGRDVGMIQRGKQFGFAMEAREPIRICDER